MPNALLTITAVMLATMLGACSKRNTDIAPAGFAVIREHVVFAPRNDPPITSELDFNIVAIDGKDVVRERIPPFVDMQPGALVPAGTHEIKAQVSPHLRPPNHQPSEAVFQVQVQSAKVYYLVDKDDRPVLIEARARP